ncbi:MAG: hypothetical protein M0024_01600 [Nitrospiraceae bacterium]|nr:hypothetical protein [Nitrospiraceae bacterium]
MRCNLRWMFYSALLCIFAFSVPATAIAEPVKLTSSTQFLWGDDWMGESQAIVAQYLRFSYTPEKSKFSAAGYGRLWQDLAGGKIRDDDFNSRLYYLYVDYAPLEEVAMRFGRQYVNLSAGSSLMDGATVNINKIGPLGLTLTGGRDIVYSLDSETSRDGNYFLGFDVHLQDVKNTRLGFSYVRKYDHSDLAKEELGMNFRYIYKWLSPYAEVRYDRLSKAFDDATVGMDLFPVHNLMLKGEFYHFYPTFDSTSIYSVFAVDKFREYLLRAEYSLEKAPVAFFGEYKRQTYEDNSNADVFVAGAKVFPTDRLTLSASVDYRHAYDDKGWGFEALADYRLNEKLLVSAGVQHDAYKRPDDEGNRYAQRYWIGGRWQATRAMTVSTRVEDNVNETFSHRALGRVTLDWNL